MSAAVQLQSETSRLRKSAGEWLKAKRLDAGLSQAELAAVVGADYYSFISQIENGRGRIPASRFKDWARALGIADREFAVNITRFYDPHLYEMLFAD